MNLRLSLSTGSYGVTGRVEEGSGKWKKTGAENPVVPAGYCGLTFRRTLKIQLCGTHALAKRHWHSKL